MSVVSILYTGQSGLSSHGDAIGIVGDNIANANTVGYKGSRANFEDVLARSLGSGGPGDIGMGSRLASVQKILTQGALLGTGVSTDLAIKGDGFFVVKGEVDGLAGNFYTRAGQFHLDADGKLTNDNGLVVQGYGVDGVQPDRELPVERGRAQRGAQGQRRARRAEQRLFGSRRLHDRPVPEGGRRAGAQRGGGG